MTEESFQQCRKIMGSANYVRGLITTAKNNICRLTRLEDGLRRNLKHPQADGISKKILISIQRLEKLRAQFAEMKFPESDIVKKEKTMQPVNFEGAKIISKPENVRDEDCFSMYAMPVEITQTGEDGNELNGRMWVEHWMPSKEDLEALNAGRGIWIQIHSIGLPPVAIFTLDENNISNDAD